MTTHTTHTPGPWKVDTSSLRHKAIVKGLSDTMIAELHWQASEEDAAHIVHCVNTFPALVEALEVLVKMVADGDWTTVELNNARKALALARKEA